MLGARTAVDQLSSSPGANPVQSLSLYMTMIGDGKIGRASCRERVSSPV